MGQILDIFIFGGVMKEINSINKELKEVIVLFESLRKENLELYNKLKIFIEMNSVIKKTEIKI